MLVRRQSLCSVAGAEVMARWFSAPSWSQWVWGNARKRWRRSEGRAARPFRHSVGRSDLSNTSTLKNLGTLLWHSNVSAPSARKLLFGICFLFFQLYKCAPEAHFCGSKNPCPSPTLLQWRGRRGDGTSIFSTELLAVVVGQRQEAIAAVRESSGPSFPLL